MKLNLGCGIDIREGYINVDNKKLKGVDIIHDLNIMPYPFEENYFDYVYSSDTLEHFIHPHKVLEELHRICKPNARIKIITGYYNSANSYNSMEHYHYFNSRCFMALDMDYKGNKPIEKSFKVLYIKLIPTRLGKLFPECIREKASFVFGELIHSIETEIEVIK